MQTKHSRWLSLAAALTVATLCLYWWPQSEQLAPEAEPTASPPRPRAPSPTSPTSPTASRVPAPFTEPTAAEIERLDAGCLVVEVQRLDFCGPRADEDCDPRAAGVQLQLLNLEHPFTREGVTNAEGHWVVPDVPAGRYIVHSSELWVSAVEFRHDETRITRVVVMAALKAKVTVVVQREDGTPVPGADVGLLVNDQSTNQWGVTDDQGVFAPEASPAGWAELRVHAPGLVPWREGLVLVTPRFTRTVVLTPGRTVRIELNDLRRPSIREPLGNDQEGCIDYTGPEPDGVELTNDAGYFAVKARDPDAGEVVFTGVPLGPLTVT